VVLFHAGSAIFPAAKYWHSNVFVGLFGWGYAGVFYFFALSGFIIAEVHSRDVGRPARLKHFLWRRFARIYPAYWLVLGGLVALGAVGIGTLPPLTNLVSSVALIGPDSHATVVAVTWTLYHEIAFYAVFAA
jgi:peptidoglycan/LPS O-acetylase OafA/YrhL